MRTIARAAVDTAAASPYTETTSARKIRIRLDRKVPYELDGGDRTKVRELRIRLEPGAVRVCVPGEAAASPPDSPDPPTVTARCACAAACEDRAVLVLRAAAARS